ncbi:hypothetical protein [Photobacterium leiognathi]|nr:hypothetical protein [Photobacterium leiognathi]
MSIKRTSLFLLPVALLSTSVLAEAPTQALYRQRLYKLSNKDLMAQHMG